MAAIEAVFGDITKQRVDAVVNAANRRMRGGGGVDGAIHRAAGPGLLQECVDRFPNGLATGDAGWTSGASLPARWVIHTVGPNYGAGEQNPDLLASCYRRSLEVADELGVQSIAFPLISAGVYRWPLAGAVAIAVNTLRATPSAVTEIRLVGFKEQILREIESALRR